MTEHSMIGRLVDAIEEAEDIITTSAGSSEQAAELLIKILPSFGLVLVDVLYKEGDTELDKALRNFLMYTTPPSGVVGQSMENSLSYRAAMNLRAEAARHLNRPKDGARLIAAERRRQVEREGWTPEHDDQHVDQELVAAAVAYACAGDYHQGDLAIDFWPWDQDGFKPDDDPVRNLVKAGALIAAEIDRLQRQRTSEGGGQ